MDETYAFYDCRTEEVVLRNEAGEWGRLSGKNARTLAEQLQSCEQDALDTLDKLIPNQTVQSALPDPDANEWYKDDVWATDGDGCGDDQIGQAYDARYHKVLPDGTFAVLTSTYFVTQFGDGTFGVTEQYETLRCSDLEDPGGTEIACDYQYNPRGYLVNHTLAEAQTEARGYAVADERRCISWFND
jgi:hypothetical protein